MLRKAEGASLVGLLNHKIATGCVSQDKDGSRFDVKLLLTDTAGQAVGNAASDDSSGFNDLCDVPQSTGYKYGQTD